MSNALYQHTCSICSKTYTRQEPWIDPKMFKNQKEAFKTATFWCPKCKSGQAVKFLMLPNAELEVVEVLNYQEICAVHNNGYYESFDNEEPEDEEDFSTLNEKKAFSLFDLD